MFESANLEHKVDKATYKHEVPHLRSALLNAQVELKAASRSSVLILIAGVEGAGKGETVNLLNEWMDPRFISTHPFFEPSEEERERPALWRFWRALPPKGRLGIFFGAWHTMPIIQRVSGEISDGEFSQQIGDIVRLEKMLCDEGVLLLKYWFHLSKPQQKRRLRELESDPKTSWRVTKREWDTYKAYSKFVRVSEPFLRKTSTSEAPWIFIPAADPRYRALTVGRHLLASINDRLKIEPSKAPPIHTALARPVDQLNLLRALKLDQPMAKDRFKLELARWQGRLNAAARDPRFQSLSVVAVFEGNDAAGKGGAIRRVTSALDARCYQNIPVAAPTQEERAQPYLWRFWRHLPRRGRFAFFDRSWYGRVLVERIEGFCPEAHWHRAYVEINDFEQAMVRNRTIVVKFWLAISKEEQLRRFKLREKTSFKQFKITEDDWRNRKKWNAYEHAVCDMVDLTSTSIAPWTLVEANNKYHARIKVLQTLCEAVESALETVKQPKARKRAK